MEQKTVFIGATGYDHYCTEGRKKLLDAGCCLIENQLGRPYTAEELKAIGGEINAVICGCEVWNEETIAAAPNLKVIVKFGVGVDNIDQEAAKRHGVQVANCPGMNSVAVAEQTFALLLGCMREVPALDRAVREGRWDRRVFPEICGSVFGVLGFGAAGREIALTALEYRLCLIFAQNRGRLLSRAQILDMLWDQGGNFVEDNTLTVYVKRLREKLAGVPDFEIQTVRGLGYRAVIR